MTLASDSLALDFIDPRMRGLSVENIASVAGANFGSQDVIPLWFGEGDIAAPAFIGEAMAQAVRDGHVFYTYQNGIPRLCEALSTYLSGLGARPVAADQISVTSGGMHAIQIALELILKPGDSIVVIDPVWPNVAGASRVIGAEVRPVSMRLGETGWTLDPAEVEAAVDGTTRAVFFASPNNPTGAVLSAETQAELLEICRRHGLWLLADEVYQRLTFGKNAEPSLTEMSEPEERVIIFNSFSKNWAMTGFRLGWMVHPPSLARHIAMAVQYSTSGTPAFIQHAAVAALEQGEPFVAFIRDYCAKGMAAACEVLEQVPRVRFGPRPTAGMYVFFTVDGMNDSRAACRDILAATRVGLAPGALFGAHSEGFLRACVSREAAGLRAAVARVADYLR